MKNHTQISVTFTLFALLAACGGNSFENGQGNKPVEGDPGQERFAPEPIRAYTPRYTGVACFTEPCPSYAATDEDGSEYELAAIDLSGLQLSADMLARVQQGIDDGQLVVLGRIIRGSWQPGGPGDVLQVTDLLTAINHYGAQFGGVACFTDPCPSWTLSSTPPIEVASLDLSLLGLDPASEEALLAQIGDGQWIVVGWVYEGSWEPGGPGAVLVVLDYHR